MPDVHKMSIEQFLSRKEAAEVEALVGSFNGGSFMCCHTQIFAQTGIWIEELVPVFQKLDAHLATTAERQVKQLSPRFAAGQ
jgi:hypothetical protein